MYAVATFNYNGSSRIEALFDTRDDALDALYNMYLDIIASDPDDYQLTRFDDDVIYQDHHAYAQIVEKCHACPKENFKFGSCEQCARLNAAHF